MIAMEIEGVRIQKETNRRYVILQSKEQPPRYLAIWIGEQEGYAIAVALPEYNTMPPPRPMTHDLFKNMLTELGAPIDRIEITRVVGEVFYALITLTVNEKQFAFDARPSDALALAARTNSPIFVAETVLDQASQSSE